MKKDSINEKIQKIPTNLMPEVLDYLDSLISKHRAAQLSPSFDFAWEGALRHLSKSFKSVELQHEASKLR